MASTQIACVGQYQACAYRVWMLDDDCSVPTTGDNAFVNTGIIRANMAADIKAGTEVEATSACGALVWRAQDVDRIKGWTLDLEIATWDWELLQAAIGGQLLTGKTGLTGAKSTWVGKSIGWAAPGPNTNTQPAVAVEIWSRTVYSTGVCPTVGGGQPKYIRHIFPRCTLQLQDRAFEEGTPANMKFQGKVVANPQLVPQLATLADWDLVAPTTGQFDDATYIQMYSNDLPTVPAGSCGSAAYTFA